MQLAAVHLGEVIQTILHIRTAMAARLRQVIEESEKEDWSKQAARVALIQT
jgi:hypothetical protein